MSDDTVDVEQGSSHWEDTIVNPMWTTAICERNNLGVDEVLDEYDSALVTEELNE